MKELEELDNHYKQILNGTKCQCETKITESENEDKTCKQKIAILELYVEDLRELVEALVGTVDELEKETNNRVKAMEQVLERTAHVTKSYMLNLSEYEQLIQSAFREKLKACSLVKKLKAKCSNLTDHNNNMAHDIQSLIRLVSHARNTGHWDIGNIEFCDVTFEQVFGSVERLSQWSNDDLLGMSFNAETRSVQDEYPLIRRNRPASTFSHSSSVRTGGAGSSGYPSKQDADLYQLQVELKQMKKLLTATQSDLSNRDRMIAELQVQITDLNHDISVKENDCFVHTQMIKKLQEDNRNSRSFSLSSPNFHERVNISALEEEDQMSSNFTEASNENLYKVPVEVSKRISDLEELVLQLRSDKESLSRQCEKQSVQIDKCNSDVASALEHNSKLELEISVTESLYQELECYKEDNENLIERLTLMKQKIKELSKKAHKKTKATENYATQTEDDNDDSGENNSAELERLRELELRHRRKAEGLETIVQELGTANAQLVKEKRELQNQIDELTECNGRENNIEKVLDLEKRMPDSITELQVLLQVVESKNEEIENQKLTIKNLQDAVVSLKRHPSVANLANGAADSRNIGVSGNSHKSRTNMREVFDI